MLPAMVEATDDTQLMTRYAAGDVGAFEALYARHKGPLYRYFFRQCGSAETSEELFQEVWIRVIKARERVRAKGPLHDLPLPDRAQLPCGPLPQGRPGS